MGDLIGDVQELRSTRIPFHAVHTVTGSAVHGHFPLMGCTGISHLAASRASVRIVSEGLTCQIIGPATAANAVEAYIAVIPSTSPVWPTTGANILTIGGSAYCQHSVYVGSVIAPLSFTQEVAHQIKPAPLVGSPPEVVFVSNVVGGTAASVVNIRISGILEVDGVGFVQTW